MTIQKESSYMGRRKFLKAAALAGAGTRTGRLCATSRRSTRTGRAATCCTRREQGSQTDCALPILVV